MNKKLQMLLCIIIIICGFIAGFAAIDRHNQNLLAAQQQPEPPENLEEIVPETEDGTANRTEGAYGTDTYTDDNGVTVLTVEYRFPDLSDSVSAEALGNIRQYYDNLAAEKKAFWEGELYNASLEESTGTGFLPYSVAEDYAVAADTNAYVSVRRLTTQMTGGVHEDQRIEGETFLKSNGALLLLSDVFSVAPETYRNTLLENIYRQMEERSAAYFENARESADSLLDEAEFYVTDTALCICYQTYDLAPYSEGYQIFEIPFVEIQDMLGEAFRTYDIGEE